MRTGEDKESISADYIGGGSSNTAVCHREKMPWGSTTEKVYDEYICQLDLDALQNLRKEEPAHLLQVSLQDFLQVLILGAILTALVSLIAWL
jgi:hypothetical protein